jgi:hypothetical protein
MSNTYYNNSNPLTPGTVAKAEDLNADRSAVEAAFDKLPTEAELANVEGTTGSVQTQIDTLDAGKADIDGETYTGAHDFTGATVTVKTTPTAANEATSKAYADNLAFDSGTLPDQTGNDGKFLQTSGGLAAWAAVANTSVNYQEFSASGIWTKPAGALLVYVEAIGGGGGGGNLTTANQVGGGAGGEFVSKTLNPSSISATETITVGSGGSGGANGTDSAGQTGGNSSFGAHLTAFGGNPGEANNYCATVPRSYISSTDVALFVIATPQAGHGGPNPGNTIYGGAGGGGGYKSESGGVSEFGGNGGAGSAVTATKAGNGATPGGGGGGSQSDGGGGDGGDGIVRVWTLVEA